MNRTQERYALVVAAFPSRLAAYPVAAINRVDAACLSATDTVCAGTGCGTGSTRMAFRTAYCPLRIARVVTADWAIRQACTAAARFIFGAAVVSAALVTIGKALPAFLTACFVG